VDPFTGGRPGASRLIENGGADVREIVGFVMGAAAGAAGALFATSTEGRALLERLRDEARPEAERATTEWEPVLREVGRAVRLAVHELETATVDLRARIGEIAAALPEDEAALAVPTLSSAAAEGDAPAAAPAVEAPTVEAAVEAAVDEAPPAVDAAVDEPASAT
jgi:gas vesicle protein